MLDVVDCKSPEWISEMKHQWVLDFLGLADTAKTIYISGPMRGYDGYNFPAFDEGLEWLQKAGWYPISPATMDRVVGIYETTPSADLPPLSEMIKKDIAALCVCSAIAFLPGWEASTGCAIEKYVAEVLDLEEYFLNPRTDYFVPLEEA